MRILLDMDGIIADLATAWYQEHNEKTGDDLTVDKVRDWDTTLFARHGTDVFAPLRRPGFYDSVKPLPGAIEGVDRLVSRGHEVFVVTAMPRDAPTMYGDKGRWLAKHLPMVSKEGLVFTQRKHVVKGDVLFDDGPHNLLDYYRAWPDAYIATVLYPYNVEASGRLLRESPRFLMAGDHNLIERAWRRFTDWVLGLEVASFQRQYAASFATNERK